MASKEDNDRRAGGKRRRQTSPERELPRSEVKKQGPDDSRWNARQRQVDAGTGSKARLEEPPRVADESAVNMPRNQLVMSLLPPHVVAAAAVQLPHAAAPLNINAHLAAYQAMLLGNPSHLGELLSHINLGQPNLLDLSHPVLVQQLLVRQQQLAALAAQQSKFQPFHGVK